MAKITVKQISARAKRIRKKGEAWITAIRRASAELKKGHKSVGAKKPARRSHAPKKRATGSHAPKRATPKKRTTKKRLQTSLKAKGLKLPHGYQVQKRSIGSAQSHYNYNILSRIKSNVYQVEQAKKNIELYKSAMQGKDKAEKLAYRRQIEAEKKNIAALKKDTTMLKRLLG